jgi:hypothetical protein
MATKAEMEKLLEDTLPIMEAWIKELQQLWPGRDVLCTLHRAEALLKRIKEIVE